MPWEKVTSCKRLNYFQTLYFKKVISTLQAFAVSMHNESSEWSHESQLLGFMYQMTANCILKIEHKVSYGIRRWGINIYMTFTGYFKIFSGNFVSSFSSWKCLFGIIVFLTQVKEILYCFCKYKNIVRI